MGIAYALFARDDRGHAICAAHLAVLQPARIA